ncbi:MAG: glycosyltransferase [Methanoregula sp.]|nr:glycosyltransferase [Methanoregula sp.]
MLKYVIVSDAHPNLNSGVLKKVRYQVDTLNNLGIKSELVIVTEENEKNEESDPIQFLYYRKLEKTTLLSRLQRVRRIRALISEIVTSLHTDDIFYYRAFGSMMFSYYPITFFKPWRKCKIISEHNSIEINEALLYKNYVSAIKNLVFGNWIIGQSEGIIGVTDEIARYWTQRLFYRKIPHVTIPNGFLVDSVSVRKPPSYDSGELHILFVGNVSQWHGLDRFIRGMAEYNGPVRVILHIVGEGDELANLKTLAHSLNCTRTIHFHGFLSGSDLDSVFNRYHIAIGSLGIHRNGMKQASALKVREYCSRGMPFMISNEDPDFPDSVTWCLHLPPDETPVSIDTVLLFYNTVCSDPNHPAIMRKYAEENLDWSIKFLKMKQFIQNAMGVKK